MRKILTSESVNIGHPDKTCDVIADAFLDAALAQDANSQMAVECAIKDNYLFIYGEATTKAKIKYEEIASEILKEIGYQDGFTFITKISQQSPEINKAVVKTDDLAANDQGIVYGYACSDTPDLMPMPIMMAHKLMGRYEKFRWEEMQIPNAKQKWFPDAKCQVSIEYDDDTPVAIHTILVSVSHCPSLSNSEIEEAIKKNVIDITLSDSSFEKVCAKEAKIIINPSGAFTMWGAHSDSGCVGRKIIVDTYGGVGRHGGGAFSSKNATKVDRSGAYYCRYVAKNLVHNGLCTKCEVSASYAIGVSDPIKINIETFGTGCEKKASKFVKIHFDFRPSNIIKELDLLKPIYKKTACYGHFGRSEFSWEKTNKYPKI